MDLQGKVIILTGVRRIGKVVAEELAKKGAILAISDRNSPPFQADLSKEEDIKRLVLEVQEKYGKIDGLVHMAANYPKTPVGDITQDQFVETMKIIAGSALLLGQEAGKVMKQNGSLPAGRQGSIIFFSDWSVLSQPYSDYSVYNMAKASINSLTKTLAKALAPTVTVNAIAPGPILEPEGLTTQEDQEVLKNTPLQRWGGAKEIAKAVIYLLESDFVTGQILTVDGGRSIA